MHTPPAHAPQPKDAHIGIVKAYALPPSPAPPALPADLAGELAAYDAAEPVSAESKQRNLEAAAGAEAVTVTGADTFLEVMEADEVRAGHH